MDKSYYIVSGTTRTKIVESNKSKKDLIKAAKEMSKEIEEGISYDEDKKRPFDLVDYYEKTNLPLNIFMRKIRDYITSGEYNHILDFYRRNPEIGNTLSKSEVKRLLKEKVYVDVEIRKKVKLLKTKEIEYYEIIPNTGREFSEEEKLEAISYILENRIPFTTDTYKAMRQRIVNGYYQKNDNKVLKK